MDEQRIADLNKQLAGANAELVKAIRTRATPDDIRSIRASIKSIQSEIDDERNSDTGKTLFPGQ
ncbi:MAG: hypothetical protein EOO15_13800 [Chitinophagaceae bacterium]|nr:MAG: hypothetical protein EOO15_13800 [Chitinophagaceae bacterium]